MKKLSILLVAVLICWAIPVFAWSPNLKVDGHLSLRTSVADNYDLDKTAVDNVNYTQLRTRLYLSSDLAENIAAKALLQKLGGDSRYGAAAETAQNIQDNIRVAQAYVTVKKIAGLVDLSAGRQEINKKFV